MKFHSEPHEKKEQQTETEPFHMHVAANESDLKASKRIANKHLQDLYSIIAFIVNGPYLRHAYIRQHGHSLKKKK